MAEARTRLLDAAERLIAERGSEASLREIALAAGQRNNAAVQYHFGDREGLIRAVIERRLAGLEARRLTLLAEAESAGRGDDIGALLAVLVAPMLDVPYAEGATHYARFLDRTRLDERLVDRLAAGDDAWPATRILIGRLIRALGLPRREAEARLRIAVVTLFALLGDREQQLALGVARPRGLGVDDLIRVLWGVLAGTGPDSGPALSSPARQGARD